MTSQLNARVRAQADLAAASARTNATLAGFLQQIAGVNEADVAAQMICDDVRRLLDVHVVLLGRDAQGGLDILAASDPTYRLEPLDDAAASWAFDTGSPAGQGSGTLTASEWLFQPLKAGDRVLGVLGAAHDAGGDPIRADRLPLLASPSRRVPAGLSTEAGIAGSRADRSSPTASSIFTARTSTAHGAPSTGRSSRRSRRASASSC